jgi:hypothetical protein
MAGMEGSGSFHTVFLSLETTVSDKDLAWSCTMTNTVQNGVNLAP